MVSVAEDDFGITVRSRRVVRELDLVPFARRVHDVLAMHGHECTGDPPRGHRVQRSTRQSCGKLQCQLTRSFRLKRKEQLSLSYILPGTQIWSHCINTLSRTHPHTQTYRHTTLIHTLTHIYTLRQTYPHTTRIHTSTHTRPLRSASSCEISSPTYS